MTTVASAGTYLHPVDLRRQLFQMPLKQSDRERTLEAVGCTIFGSDQGYGTRLGHRFPPDDILAEWSWCRANRRHQRDEVVSLLVGAIKTTAATWSARKFCWYWRF
jgi:hypothetical protein